jgi:DNA replication and repair protein RecF
MFGAQDLELVLGPPSVRRRYLDILISQLDQRYLKALQRYQRVVSQRNRLLKTIREGRAQTAELQFWDDELAASGACLMHGRAVTIAALSRLSAPIHERLADGENLRVAYDPSGEVAAGESEDDAGLALTQLLEQRRSRDIGQGFTTAGPHRDDLRLTLDGMEAGPYASRGQCRTVALALKLAEAAYLKDRRGQEPVVLLDDVLSELDAHRRVQVLEAIGQYEQCFITTADHGLIDSRYLQRMSRFIVRHGQVGPVDPADMLGAE